MDVLSDALRMIRLKGALFLNAECREPWCVAAPTGADLASRLRCDRRSKPRRGSATLPH